MIWIMLLILPICSVFAETRDNVKALEEIRPNAKYVMTGNSLKGLVWLDSSTQKPTQKELDDGWSQYLAKESDDKTAKDQAKAILKDSKSTDAQKLDAIIKVLDLNK